MLVSEYNDVKESVAIDISEEAQRDTKPKERNRRRKRKSCLSEASIHTFRTGVEGIGA